MMKVLLCIFIFLYLTAEINSRRVGCGCSRKFMKKLGKRGIEIFGEEINDNILEKRSEDDRIVEDDQMFTTRDFAVFGGFRASAEEEKRWPDNTLIYYFKDMSSQDQTTIKNALSKLSQNTNNCIKFKEATTPPSKGGYVEVGQGQGCYSYVGHFGKKQTMSLSRLCLTERTIQHEFMHALGFYHEQNRPDRDDYINIVWDNIRFGTCSQFQKCRGCKTTTPYDIKSIMHYWAKSFSCNRKVTLINKKDPSTQIVMVEEMSELDKKKIMDYYGCK